MTFTLLFIFSVCGLVCFIIGEMAMGKAKTHLKLAKVIQLDILREHVALLRTYRDVIKYSKTVRDPYNVVYDKEKSKPTIQ